MMLVRDLFTLSFHSLLLHKVRSILTSLGIIFGVGSVVAMLAISEGAKDAALSQIASMGINQIIVYSKRPPVEGQNTTNSSAGIIEYYGLDAIDLKNIKGMDNVADVTTMQDTRHWILKGTIRTDLKLVSVDKDFLARSSSMMNNGRWFFAGDFKNDLKVCVIGSNVKRKLFSLNSGSLIGQKLQVEGEVFTIIGVLHNDIGTQYPDLGSPNDMVLIPSSTAKKIYQDYACYREGATHKVAKVEYDTFLIRVHDIQYIDNTSKRLQGYFSKVHNSVKDWEIVVPLDLLKQREQTQNIFTIVMASIASISLIVGGIGIMNIMLASVFERRKEIGTRRALGAQKSDILLQFLIETVFLTTMGGMLGVVMGVAISYTITVYADMPVVYQLWSILAALIISSVVGVVFGTYPAWKAAQQNPITVLRSE